MLATLVEVRMRKFEEGCENIEVLHPLWGQVAMWIELACNQHARSDNGARTLQKVAFAIVIALRHHCAVKAQHHRIDRHGGLELVKDFVAQFLESLTLQQPARFRPGGCALDHGEAFCRRPLAQCHDG